MSIKWAIDLGIPDIIHKHGQPITLPELVSALKVPQAKATCVQRLMRLLAHNDYFASSTLMMIAMKPTPQLGEWTCGEDLTIIETALGPGCYWDFIHQDAT
ncbi:Isoflavone 7-O-methyltransferase [Spatholobus suberectus]|nr:Isoflavone 7-O-methyltransferase [Spatholobus suberectus]